jgi:hypothetical protein
LKYGADYLKTKPDDTEIALALAQARYLCGDFQGAKTSSEQLIASNAKPPKRRCCLPALPTTRSRTTPVPSGPGRPGQALSAAEVLEDLLNNQLFGPRTTVACVACTG